MRYREAGTATAWIKWYYPKAVKFEADYSTIEVIEQYIKINTPEHYGTLMHLYGVLYLLGLIKYYSSKEKYEVAASMLKAIEMHNEKYSQSLPLDIDSEEARDYLNLRPSEILETHMLIENLKSGKPL